MMSVRRKIVDKEAQRAVKRKLSVVDRILKICHGTPDMGNVSNPLEELIFLTITQRTRIETAIRIFRNLKKEFPHPKDILMTPESELKKILSSGGRGNLRAKAVKEIIRAVSEKTGAFSLEGLKEKNENEVFDFLMCFPRVGGKVASLVLKGVKESRFGIISPEKLQNLDQNSIVRVLNEACSRFWEDRKNFRKWEEASLHHIRTEILGMDS